MLRALIETYLREAGFTSYQGRPGTYPLVGFERTETFWWHRELGGRTFEQAVEWQMGREAAEADRRRASA